MRALISLAAVLLAASAFAQTYPASVRVIVPFRRALCGRRVAQPCRKSSPSVGQPVVLEHKPGAARP